MKVASLIYGEYRTFETAIKAWNILDYDNIDYYVSTWDRSREQSIKLNYNNDFKVDEDMISKYLPSAKISLKNHSIWDEGTLEDYFWPAHYHWKCLYEMVEKSKIKYDIIILHRLDCYLYLHEFVNLINNLDSNTLYSLMPIHKNHNNDWWSADTFFMGNSDVMLDFLSKTPKYMDDPHVELAYFIKSLKYSCISHPDMYSNIIRNTMTTYFDNYFKNNKTLLFNDEYFKYFLQVYEKNIHGRLESEYK
jgi:hypothetical protein